MNVRRMKRLLRILEDYHAEEKHKVRFDLSNWLVREGCGTQACAFGLYMLRTRSVKRTQSSLSHGMYLPGDDPRTSFQYVAEHFGITPDDAHRLFNPDNYNSDYAVFPVIRRVRSYIKKHEAATSKRKVKAAR